MTTKRMIGGLVLGAALLAGCGSSSSKTSSGATDGTSTGSDEPGAALAVAKAGSLGDVLVDGRGRTVYVLTADGTTNAPCDDASGCTKAWPDVSLPDGVTAAKAGDGVDSSLLGAKKVGAETYPTYKGWLLYEFSGDSKSGQANGEGIKSFGGTWYALDAKGMPITSSSSRGSGY
jgi:predicted lipoprotein with Yx(FWY)xxD motif